MLEQWIATKYSSLRERLEFRKNNVGVDEPYYTIYEFRRNERRILKTIRNFSHCNSNVWKRPNPYQIFYRRNFTFRQPLWRTSPLYLFCVWVGFWKKEFVQKFELDNLVLMFFFFFLFIRARTIGVRTYLWMGEKQLSRIFLKL